MIALDPACAGLLPLLPKREDAPALRDESTAEWMTRREARQQALEIAAALALPRKGLVFLFSSNRVITVTALLAAGAAGHAVALIDPSLDASKAQALLDAYKPNFILWPGSIASTGAELIARGQVRLEKREAPDTAIAPELCLLLSTSGTTGSSKFVRLSYRAVTANAEQIATALRITAEDVAVEHLPVHYSYGFSVLASHLVRGAGVFLMDDSITAPSFWPKVQQARGTHFPGVPFHYTVLARFGLAHVPGSVQTFTQAGGALDLGLQRKLQGQIAARGGRFFVMYGQTEAAPRMTTLPSEDFGKKSGSVGVALKGGRLEIRDDDGHNLPANEIGTVHYTGPNVMLGYAVSRADLAAADELQGHLDTGDLGYLDADSFLFLSGRTQRFAKIGGLRLGLEDIERELAPIATVAALDKGERIAVFYETGDEAALRKKLKALTLEYKILPSSFLLRSIQSLPRMRSGKIDYARLKALTDV